MAKSLVSEFTRSAWEGRREIIIRQKIVDGPQAFIDRHVNLSLTFEQIQFLVGQMNEANKRLELSESMLAAINAANSE